MGEQRGEDGCPRGRGRKADFSTPPFAKGAKGFGRNDGSWVGRRRMPRQKQRGNFAAGRADCDSTRRELHIPTLGAKRRTWGTRLDGEEDVVEDVVEGVEECGDELAAEEEEDDEANMPMRS